MGICCCLPFVPDEDREDERDLNPDPDMRRRQMAEAAEKRQKSMEYRGVKDPESYKRRQKRQEKLDELDTQPSENTNLRAKHKEKMTGTAEKQQKMKKYGGTNNPGGYKIQLNQEEIDELNKLLRKSTQ